MRSIIFAMLIAASTGMAGTSGISAAPANGASLGSTTATLGNTDQVHYYGRGYYGRSYYGRGYYGRGSYGRSYYGGGGYYGRGYYGRGYGRGHYGYRY